MTTTTTLPANPAPRKKLDLTHINNLHDLHLEQKRVKLRLKMQEIELKQRVKKIPGEALKAGAKAVVPAFIAGKLTNSAVGGLLTGLGFLFPKSKTSKGGKLGLNIVGGLARNLIGKVGVFSALRMAAGLLGRKKK